MSIEVQDTQFDLDSVLMKLGYPSDEFGDIKNSDVLLLPTDLDSAESYYFDKSVSLKKAIERQLSIGVLAKQGSKTRYTAQRTAEIVIPVLVFLGWQVFDVAKGIISDWLAERLSRFRLSGRKPNAKLRFIVVDEKRKTKKELTYEGPAEPLCEILRQFKASD